VDKSSELQEQAKGAGEVIIGGLRCSMCASLFRPDETTRNELCRACHYLLLIKERWPTVDARIHPEYRRRV
jgi:DNA-directed RNA polymerase subunit RPC12/RpoP